MPVLRSGPAVVSGAWRFHQNLMADCDRQISPPAWTLSKIREPDRHP